MGACSRTQHNVNRWKIQAISLTPHALFLLTAYDSLHLCNCNLRQSTTGKTWLLISTVWKYAGSHRNLSAKGDKTKIFLLNSTSMRIQHLLSISWRRQATFIWKRKQHKITKKWMFLSHKHWSRMDGCSVTLQLIGFSLLVGIFFAACHFFYPNFYSSSCMYIRISFQRGMLLVDKFCKKAILYYQQHNSGKKTKRLFCGSMLLLMTRGTEKVYFSP